MEKVYVLYDNIAENVEIGEKVCIEDWVLEVVAITEDTEFCNVKIKKVGNNILNTPVFVNGIEFRNDDLIEEININGKHFFAGFVSAEPTIIDNERYVEVLLHPEKEKVLDTIDYSVIDEILMEGYLKQITGQGFEFLTPNYERNVWLECIPYEGCGEYSKEIWVNDRKTDYISPKELQKIISSYRTELINKTLYRKDLNKGIWDILPEIKFKEGGKL